MKSWLICPMMGSIQKPELHLPPMNTYEKIVLRKDNGKLTLNGYHPAGRHGVRTFEVLYHVIMHDDGNLELKNPVSGHIEGWCNSWSGVNGMLQHVHGLPLYGLHKADSQVMDFLKERERMMDRALMEYALPKGQRRGLPPGRMDDQAVREVESFADWKRRKDHWESIQLKNVASPS